MSGARAGRVPALAALAVRAEQLAAFSGAAFQPFGIHATVLAQHARTCVTARTAQGSIASPPWSLSDARPARRLIAAGSSGTACAAINAGGTSSGKA
jgi:hypothetical protein